MEILNKYKRNLLHYTVDKSRIYDFALSLDNTPETKINGYMVEDGLISYIDFNNSGCVTESGAKSLPNYVYKNAINTNPLLLDYGYTAVDNGGVKYDKDIDLESFISVMSGSPLQITEEYNNLILKKVEGNTKYFNYECNPVINSSGKTYYSFNGGFLQGFFKIDGEYYQVLPNNIAQAWTLDFILRPRNYEHISGQTINDIHPKNNGIFFYIGTRSENKFGRFYNKDLSRFKNRNISGGTNTSTGKTYNLQTSNLHEFENNNYFEITTDNKYLFFNRTCDGYNTKTWEDGNVVKIIQNNPTGNENLYLYMNRTCSGYTTHNIDKYLETLSGNSKYNITEDIKNNAFALKLNDNGSISYRYLIKDCNNESGFSIVEESTFSGLVKNEEWVDVTVIFRVLDGNLDNCDNPYDINRKMKIFIYVNGFLKLVSKELPCFNFRRIDNFYDKQEGVPFNISLGGGTQGLLESMWTDNYKEPFYKILPIEENFCGSFIGDISSFKFYDKILDINEIRNNTINNKLFDENFFC